MLLSKVPSLASVPTCHPGRGAMPLAEAGALLQTLAASVMVEPNTIIWQGEAPCPLSFSGQVEQVDFGDSRACTSQGDVLLVMALPLTYQKSWGSYGGLLGQYLGDAGQSCSSSVAIQYVEHCLRRYEYARRHVRFGMDEGGGCYVSLPRHLVAGYGQPGEIQVALQGVAADDGCGGYLEVFSTGPFIAYRLNPDFRAVLEKAGWRFSPGQSRSAGRDLRHLRQSFAPLQAGGEAEAYADILLPVLGEILSSDTPRLAATCYLLDHKFRELVRVVEAGAGIGRRVVGIAGMLLDMHGFQSRNEQLFVPWQALLPDRDGSRGNLVCLDQQQLVKLLAELALVAA